MPTTPGMISRNAFGEFQPRLLRGIGQKHAKWADRAEWDDLELHQPCLAESKLA
jgi:hypothetical protein